MFAFWSSAEAGLGRCAVIEVEGEGYNSSGIMGIAGRQRKIGKLRPFVKGEKMSSMREPYLVIAAMESGKSSKGN